MQRQTEIAGSHAIVTGGARGIGLATTKRLLAAGARVSIWDLDAAALTAAVEDLPGSVHTEQCDITDRSAVEGALEASVQALGPVDILINNAGHLAPGNLVDQPPEVWVKSLSVNVDALIVLTRLVLPEMYRRGRGHIVNISSAAGAIGVPGLAVYSAAKWAVWGFSEALRAESRGHGVRITSIHPSYIASGMFEGARLTGLGRFIVPLLRDHDVVARAIVEEGLKRGRTRVMRPRSVRLAVLFRGVLPDSWFNGLMRILGVWDSMGSWHGRG